MQTSVRPALSALQLRLWWLPSRLMDASCLSIAAWNKLFTFQALFPVNECCVEWRTGCSSASRGSILRRSALEEAFEDSKEAVYQWQLDNGRSIFPFRGQHWLTAITSSLVVDIWWICICASDYAFVWIRMDYHCKSHQVVWWSLQTSGASAIYVVTSKWSLGREK